MTRPRSREDCSHPAAPLDWPSRGRVSCASRVTAPLARTLPTRAAVNTRALVLLSLVSAACSSEAANPPPAPVDWHAFDAPHGPVAATQGPTARERAVGEAYANALTSPGLSELAPRLAGDVHFSFPGMSDTRGRDGVLKAHETLFGSFDRRAIAVSRLLRTDSETTVEWTMTGVQARDWMGVPAT